MDEIGIPSDSQISVLSTTPRPIQTKGQNQAIGEPITGARGCVNRESTASCVALGRFGGWYDGSVEEDLARAKTIGA
jgi:hypothetical protein